MFLIGDVGIGKTFVEKLIFQALVKYYNKQLGSDPLKNKGLLLAYNDKDAYNIGGATAHSILHLQFRSSIATPLDSNTVDLLSKQYEQLRLILIDEISSIGIKMLFNMDKIFSQILHM